MFELLQIASQPYIDQYASEGLLQIVSEPDIDQCASEGLLQIVSGSNIDQCANEDVGSSRGWIVRSRIS